MRIIAVFPCIIPLITIDDSVYSSNINTFDNYALSAFLLIVSEKEVWVWVSIINRFPILILSYEEEVRNNRNTDNDVYPEKIAVNKIDNEGSLNKTAFVTSFAYGLSDYVDLNLGIEYALLNGDINQEKTIRWTRLGYQSGRRISSSGFNCH